MTSVPTDTLSSTRPLLRYLRTPKGLCLVIFIGLVVASWLKSSGIVATTHVIVAAVAAAAIDVAVTYVRRGKWTLPDGAVLTGMIIAFVLRPQEGWLVLIVTVAVAILSKHALRTRWSNVLNPAAAGLVFAAIVFHTGQSWWGALPDLGIIGALILVVAAGLIADRINKLPMILAFLGVYVTLFTVASAFRSAIVSEIFVTPDLQAALFFAFFMLDDPPTSPVRHEDQVVFGAIVAAVAYFAFMQFGVVYFLLAGLLAGNIWESARRVILGLARSGELSLSGLHAGSGLRIAGGLGAAAVVPLILVSGIFATSAPAATSSTANAYAFQPSFQGDLNGTYTQENSATSGHVVLDGLATGDLPVGVHVEVLQQAVVPPPDDESIEAEPDDEEIEAEPQVTTMINTAQLVDPDSKGLLCDGQLTALSRGTMRFICDGTAAYAGVQMDIASQLNASPDGTFTGPLQGIMQRTD